MKIKKSQLERIITEELDVLLREQGLRSYFTGESGGKFGGRFGWARLCKGQKTGDHHVLLAERLDVQRDRRL